jgi:hypothetical protein
MIPEAPLFSTMSKNVCFCDAAAGASSPPASAATAAAGAAAGAGAAGAGACARSEETDMEVRKIPVNNATATEAKIPLFIIKLLVFSTYLNFNKQ